MNISETLNVERMYRVRSGKRRKEIEDDRVKENVDEKDVGKNVQSCKEDIFPRVFS